MLPTCMCSLHLVHSYSRIYCLIQNNPHKIRMRRMTVGNYATYIYSLLHANVCESPTSMWFSFFQQQQKFTIYVCSYILCVQ